MDLDHPGHARVSVRPAGHQRRRAGPGDRRIERLLVRLRRRRGVTGRLVIKGRISPVARLGGHPADAPRGGRQARIPVDHRGERWTARRLPARHAGAGGDGVRPFYRGPVAHPGRAHVHGGPRSGCRSARRACSASARRGSSLASPTTRSQESRRWDTPGADTHGGGSSTRLETLGRMLRRGHHPARLPGAGRRTGWVHGGGRPAGARLLEAQTTTRSEIVIGQSGDVSRLDPHMSGAANDIAVSFNLFDNSRQSPRGQPALSGARDGMEAPESDHVAVRSSART